MEIMVCRTTPAYAHGCARCSVMCAELAAVRDDLALQVVRLFGALPMNGPARFSTVEFVNLIEHTAPLGIRLELIAGELSRMSPHMSTHASRQTEKALLLYQFVRGTDRQAMVDIGTDLGNNTVHAHGEPVAGNYAEGHTVRFGRPSPVPGTATSIVIG